LKKKIKRVAWGHQTFGFLLPFYRWGTSFWFPREPWRCGAPNSPFNRKQNNQATC